jgi:N-acetyl sugar amidotransferase
MDTSARDITFDANGVCNYCTLFLGNTGHIIYEDPKEKQDRLDSLIRLVKQSGYGKPYDCVVGVSGGVDSSWALVQAVRLGLRPLAVHMDNGWNSELAQNNIENLVRGLKVDLYTHVINWGEYRALMQAFFDADVIDIELLYDNAMLATNWRQAAKFGLKFILTGSNTASEGMTMPRNWNWSKYDKRNIRSIAKRFGGVKIRSFPAIGTFDRIWHEVIRSRRWIAFLDYLEYNKFDAMSDLQKRYGYKAYPYKHYESIFTRFYQGFILPKKFGVDKRRLHLSTLIAAGQLERTKAVENLKGIPYPSGKALDEDKIYFLKKMNWTDKQLLDYLDRPRVEHDIYPSERWFYETLTNFARKLTHRKRTV